MDINEVYNSDEMDTFLKRQITEIDSRRKRKSE